MNSRRIALSIGVVGAIVFALVTGLRVFRSESGNPVSAHSASADASDDVEYGFLD